MEWSKCWMPHRHTFRNRTHWAWAMWDMSNHDLFGIIADPGSQKWIALSLECISTLPCQAGTSYVKILEWGQHSSNCGMPCLSSVFGTFQGTGDQPNENPGALFRCLADIFLNVINCEMQWPGILITQMIGQLSVVGCTNDWHNHCWTGTWSWLSH